MYSSLFQKKVYEDSFHLSARLLNIYKKDNLKHRFWKCLMFKKVSYEPANHSEPGKTVVEWITSSDGLDIEIRGCRRQFCLVVIHFSHQFKSLSAQKQKRRISVVNQFISFLAIR